MSSLVAKLAMNQNAESRQHEHSPEVVSTVLKSSEAMKHVF